MDRNTIRIGIITSMLLVRLLLPSAVTAQSDHPAQKRIDPVMESDIAYQYSLFNTTNIWTFILLDTATGRAWQIQRSSDEYFASRILINGNSLLHEGTKFKNGRFTLYPTHNMYTFMLLDREDSRIWQLYWSQDPKNRGISRTIP